MQHLALVIAAFLFASHVFAATDFSFDCKGASANGQSIRFKVRGKLGQASKFTKLDGVMNLTADTSQTKIQFSEVPAGGKLFRMNARPVHAIDATLPNGYAITMSITQTKSFKAQLFNAKSGDSVDYDVTCPKRYDGSFK